MKWQQEGGGVDTVVLGCRAEPGFVGPTAHSIRGVLIQKETLPIQIIQDPGGPVQVKGPGCFAPWKAGSTPVSIPDLAAHSAGLI